MAVPKWQFRGTYLPEEIIYALLVHKTISPGELNLLILVISTSNNEADCHMTNKTMAFNLDCDVRNVEKRIASLVEKGWLQSNSSPGKRRTAETGLRLSDKLPGHLPGETAGTSSRINKNKIKGSKTSRPKDSQSSASDGFDFGNKQDKEYITIARQIIKSISRQSKRPTNAKPERLASWLHQQGEGLGPWEWMLSTWEEFEYTSLTKFKTDAQYVIKAYETRDDESFEYLLDKYPTMAKATGVQQFALKTIANVQRAVAAVEELYQHADEAVRAEQEQFNQRTGSRTEAEQKIVRKLKRQRGKLSRLRDWLPREGNELSWWCGQLNHAGLFKSKFYREKLSHNLHPLRFSLEGKMFPLLGVIQRGGVFDNDNETVLRKLLRKVKESELQD